MIKNKKKKNAPAQDRESTGQQTKQVTSENRWGEWTNNQVTRGVGSRQIDRRTRHIKKQSKPCAHTKQDTKTHSKQEQLTSCVFTYEPRQESMRPMKNTSCACATQNKTKQKHVVERKMQAMCNTKQQSTLPQINMNHMLQEAQQHKNYMYTF